MINQNFEVCDNIGMRNVLLTYSIVPDVLNLCATGYFYL